MSNEKFIKALDNLKHWAIQGDALPTIPKEIGDYIERQKHRKSTLRAAIIAATDFHDVDDDEADWIFYQSDVFALAWLLGAWIESETGEIVKAEAEK